MLFGLVRERIYSDWFEEPPCPCFAPKKLEGINIPLAQGENLHTLFSFMALQTNVLQFPQPDVGTIGDTPWLQVDNSVRIGT